MPQNLNDGVFVLGIDGVKQVHRSKFPFFLCGFPRVRNSRAKSVTQKKKKKAEPRVAWVTQNSLDIETCTKLASPVLPHHGR